MTNPNSQYFDLVQKLWFTKDTKYTYYLQSVVLFMKDLIHSTIVTISTNFTDLNNRSFINNYSLNNHFFVWSQVRFLTFVFPIRLLFLFLCGLSGDDDIKIICFIKIYVFWYRLLYFVLITEQWLLLNQIANFCKCHRLFYPPPPCHKRIIIHVVRQNTYKLYTAM